MQPLILPQVNINGTSREALIDQLREVIAALNLAINTMASAMPHGRDYHFRPAEYTPAREAWSARIATVVDLKDEVTAHAIRLQQGD